MNKKGFTLLELMTIVAIMAVLAVVAAPRFSRSLKNAQVRECEATRVIVTRAEQRYAGEHEGKHSKGIEDLLKSGYLQTPPRCTGGGTYAWVPDVNGAKGERRVICSVHGDSQPGSPENILTPVKPTAPPKSAADCPPDTDYIPKAYFTATKTLGPACAPKCPYGQIRVPAWRPDSCKTPSCVAGYRWDPAALNCVRK